jgi:hypothetical protein
LVIVFLLLPFYWCWAYLVVEGKFGFAGDYLSSVFAEITRRCCCCWFLEACCWWPWHSVSFCLLHWLIPHCYLDCWPLLRGYFRSDDLPFEACYISILISSFKLWLWQYISVLLGDCTWVGIGWYTLRHYIATHLELVYLYVYVSLGGGSVCILLCSYLCLLFGLVILGGHLLLWGGSVTYILFLLFFTVLLLCAPLCLICCSSVRAFSTGGMYLGCSGFSLLDTPLLMFRAILWVYTEHVYYGLTAPLQWLCVPYTRGRCSAVSL